MLPTVQLDPTETAVTPETTGGSETSLTVMSTLKVTVCTSSLAAIVKVRTGSASKSSDAASRSSAEEEPISNAPSSLPAANEYVQQAGPASSSEAEKSPTSGAITVPTAALSGRVNCTAEEPT